ncbi:MAG: hypothetical protein KBA06_02965 [Saprospiraceae bacterium]|nr:hypothetical protein [Saprospiraceae bacterium]
MIKSLKSIFVLLLISSLFVVSCKKDDAQSTSEILSSKTWEFEAAGPTAVTTNPEILAQITALNLLGQGTKYNFKSDGTYKVTNSSATEIESGTWTLSSDNKTLTTKETSSSDSTSATITSISSSDLKLQDTGLTSSNVQFTYILDFK